MSQAEAYRHRLHQTQQPQKPTEDEADADVFTAHSFLIVGQAMFQRHHHQQVHQAGQHDHQRDVMPQGLEEA